MLGFVLPALVSGLIQIETATVHATIETTAVASIDDAADDPSIWRDSKHPERSLIVATDKKAGLNVYDLDGKLRFSLPAGRVNNVDLRAFRVGSRTRVIVAASDRTDVAHAQLALFELDPRRVTLRKLAGVPVGDGEAYGLCLYRPKRGKPSAFVVMKDGTIRQVALTVGRDSVSGSVVRTMKLATQSEGCVADDRTGDLFVAEEDVGIWHFGADASAPVAGRKIAAVDGVRLFADVEGLAIAATGKRGGWLIASSQGDSAYAAWRLGDLAYAGRFRIAPGATIDGTSDTDGIEVSTASFGARGRDGLMIAQDGDNAPEAQNFKIVRWRDVRDALRLR